MTGGGEGTADVVAADRLVAGFLASHIERTRQAYAGDIEDFARMLDRPPAVAVAMLLGAGRDAAQRLVLDFAIDLRERGRAEATILRRLATLRSLAGTARHLGMIDWSVQVPSRDQITAAIEEREVQASYLLPRHPSEIDRLDVQHYAMKAAMRVDYLSPVTAPERVLDVGCGTGQWGFDVCQRLPQALVVGVDLVPGKPERPPRYRWVRANILRGLPFPDGSFDLVHQRFLIVAVPVAAWGGLVDDLVRVTRPGGWVELTEPRMEQGQGATATTRLIELGTEMAAALGLDTTYHVFSSLDAYLEEAGLATVTRRELTVPVGRWGGEIGALMAADMRAAFTRMCEVMQARAILEARESDEMIKRAQAEWEEQRSVWKVAVAFGQKG
jgi:SAM-dependent methyltransferase